MSDGELASLFGRREAIAKQIGDLERELIEIDKQIVQAQQQQSRAELPCWSCDRPQAADVRHQLRSNADADAGQASPAGLPMGCCRVRTFSIG
jgi:hypothetical protein